MSVQRAKNLVARGYTKNLRGSRPTRYKIKKSKMEVLAAWIKKVGSIEKNIQPENVPALLNDMRLYSPKAQVGEMLECAKEASERRHITEFYNFTPSQIKRSHDRGNLRQLSRNEQKKRKPRKMSKHVATNEVFLGGSCNPTTWRRDVAIPILESLNITYYNPQVSEWRAELVEVEHRAKESAKVLFYVLDRCTRNVVGLIEAANFAGSRRHLVLVADNYAADQLVGGEALSHTEYEDLCSGLLTLKCLLELQGIPVFNNIPAAINWTSQILSECYEPLRRSSFKKSIITDDAIKIRKLREIFDALKPNGRGEINLSDFYIAYQLLTKKQSLIDLKTLSSPKDLNPEGVKINFEQFCSMVRDVKNAAKPKNGTNEKSTLCCKTTRSIEKVENIEYDLYISGPSCNLDWKEDSAIPQLQKSGLKYLMVESDVSRTPSETLMMDRSNLLVFLITGNTRGLNMMALASYYIGAGKKMILCIQQLEESNEINGEKISTSALNDYNRGRVYLRDLAVRNGVEVYDDLTVTVQKAIEKCKSTESSS